jgi:hypothetical protein
MDVTALCWGARWSDHERGEVNRPTNTDVGVAQPFAPARNIALLPADDN